MMANRPLAVVAHPDDIEFLMAGTLLLLGQAGWEPHYMTIANGCCGSTGQTRRPRDASRGIGRAAQYLGAAYHECLTNNLEIFYDLPTLQRLASVVRLVAPRILLTHSPMDYMEDRTNACRLAVTAAFIAACRLRRRASANPVPQDVTVYHAQPHGHTDALGQPVTPEFLVDISSVIQQKAEMLGIHESQPQLAESEPGYGLVCRNDATTVAGDGHTVQRVCLRGGLAASCASRFLRARCRSVVRRPGVVHSPSAHRGTIAFTFYLLRLSATMTRRFVTFSLLERENLLTAFSASGKSKSVG